jgi:hypothetical protein
MCTPVVGGRSTEHISYVKKNLRNLLLAPSPDMLGIKLPLTYQLDGAPTIVIVGPAIPP